jgi:drug/metabolite transporter (DMT)-like permease
MPGGLSIAQVLQLVTVVTLLAVGQLLFKAGALQGQPVRDLASLIRLFSAPLMLAALALYAVTTLLWVYTLQSVPLSRAYPFTALGFVLVPLASARLFDEVLGGRYLAGVALLLAGLYLTASAEG